VGSTSKKAKRIEYGTMPEENRDLKDAEIIAWYRRNGIPNAVREGRSLARHIREFGTPPKPVLRTAIDKTKSQKTYILRKTKQQITKRIKKLQ
jgi:hypothetical protein